MTIVFDILHPAHINLFKETIKTLDQNNHQIIVICINRGKLPVICKDELGSIDLHVIGRHRNNKASIIFESNILRFILLLKFLLFKRVDVGISFGSFLLGAVLRIKGVRNIHLSDDPERKVNALLELITCTERYMPPIVIPRGKTMIFNALKEWSYLSPAYFVNDDSILVKYNLQKKHYIFVREVSTGSLNYSGQSSGLIASISSDIPENVPVILSLEDKSIRKQYPSNWRIIEEPETRIHSIIFNSKAVISSGDSMAREGAMLGVPSIYCGRRKMAANKIMMSRGMLWHIGVNEVGEMIRQLWEGKIAYPSLDEFRKKLEVEWDNVNEFILKIITKEKK